MSAIFINKQGNDKTARRGSKKYAFLTFDAAYNKAKDGDTIFIGAGEYKYSTQLISKRISIVGTMDREVVLQSIKSKQST